MAHIAFIVQGPADQAVKFPRVGVVLKLISLCEIGDDCRDDGRLLRHLHYLLVDRGAYPSFRAILDGARNLCDAKRGEYIDLNLEPAHICDPCIAASMLAAPHRLP